MIIVNHEQGTACDIAEVWLDDDEEDHETIVTLGYGDDDEFFVQYKNGQGKTVSIYFPLERLKKLIEGAAQ